MNKQKNSISPNFWVSSKFQRKKLKETVSSRRKKTVEKNVFFSTLEETGEPWFALFFLQVLSH